MDQSDIDTQAAIAALLALTEHGIPPDTQELLVHGSKRAGVAPGALSAALKAALATYQQLMAQ